MIEHFAVLRAHVQLMKEDAAQLRCQLDSGCAELGQDVRTCCKLRAACNAGACTETFVLKVDYSTRYCAEETFYRLPEPAPF